jgi:hypothetical protein
LQRIRIKCLPGSSFKLSGSHFKKNIKKIKNVPEGIRTPDTRLRRPVLYPTELQTHMGYCEYCNI